MRKQPRMQTQHCRTGKAAGSLTAENGALVPLEVTRWFIGVDKDQRADFDGPVPIFLSFPPLFLSESWSLWLTNNPF